MIVALRIGKSLILTQGKIKYGRWIVGNKYINRMASECDMIPLDFLTERHRQQIVRQARETQLERIETQLTIHPELADKREEWIAAANKITFDDVLREAEQDAEFAKL